MLAEKVHAKVQSLLFAALILLISLPMSLRAGEALVSGQYLSAASREIQLQITVANPAPSTLIVIQKLPSGTVVEAAAPAFHQYDEGKGEGKWLLTQVKPGRYTLSLRLPRPVASPEISGEIRYKDPASGRMINLPVRP